MYIAPVVAGGEAKRKGRWGSGDGGGGESEEEDGELPASAPSKRQRHQPIVWRAAPPPTAAAPAAQERQPGPVRQGAPSEPRSATAALSQQLSDLRTQALLRTAAVPTRGGSLHLAADSAVASPNGRAPDSAARLRSSSPGTPGRGISPQPAAPSPLSSGLAADAGEPVKVQSATAIAAAELAAFQAAQLGGGDIDQNAPAAMRSSPSGSEGAPPTLDPDPGCCPLLLLCSVLLLGTRRSKDGPSTWIIRDVLG